MKDLSSISYIEKRNFVAGLYNMHKKIKFSQNLELNLGEKIGKNIPESLIQDMKQESTFEKIMKLLEPEYVFLIQKEFVENDRKWFKDRWSKTTYYKSMNKALDRFLFYLYG
ncbi:MG284/MPN403 family protein [Mesomycoplasma neurolyticum]|uniref:Uncharacterized protein n=1 Tax=Mesomycoplasma neurolyticum TaxID=2120 RepID=A0A449A6F2_9BACT|nr:hypothetical protein [Mesomycoplasma neurolyticum]VEU59808.1 Uncharacterised protein [Mesomycoplasma neurolyticum]